MLFHDENNIVQICNIHKQTHFSSRLSQHILQNAKKKKKRKYNAHISLTLNKYMLNSHLNETYTFKRLSIKAMLISNIQKLKCELKLNVVKERGKNTATYFANLPGPDKH